MTKKIDDLLSSNYDGIKEYDNDLPKWWLILFWITIIFGAVYYCFYTFGPGLTSDQRLAQELEAIKKLKQSVPAAAVSSSEDLLKIVNNPDLLAKGKVSYVAKCAACHGDLGQGIVGPNLTDDYWIHGGKIEAIKKTIEVGVLDKGMLAWKDLMSSEEIDQVTAYVFSLRGSNPANPKEPQGTKEN